MKDVGYVTKPMPIKDYRKLKIKMLKKEFCFNLTQEECDHFNTLETEPAIDRYCRSLYNKYLK